MDQNQKDFCEIVDLKKFYNYKKQPHFLSGEKTQEEIFELFLKNFDIKSHLDKKVINYKSNVEIIFRLQKTIF